MPGSRTAGSGNDSRVDPFLLPPDTPFRFGLLLLAIVSTSLFAYQMVFLARHDTEFAETYLRCGPDPNEELSPEASVAAQAAAALCRQGFDRSEAGWMLAGVALLVVVSIGLLLAVPWLRTRRVTYIPVDAQESPEIALALQGLAERAGTPGVEFLLDPLDARTSAFAFGRPGRRRVVLRGGLVTLLVTDRSSFDAVVLHELAHVRNRDIDQAYVSLTTFAAFVLVAVIPFAAVLQGGLPVWPMLWRFAALTILVYLLFAALLRSREAFADARASEWGEGTALATVLGRARQHPPRLVRRMVALHPAPRARVKALEDPTPLFRLSLPDALAVGLVASIALPQLVFLVGLFTGASLDSAAWAAVPVSPLIAGFLTVGIWRQRYFEASTGHTRGPVWPLGVGLGLGISLGPTLSINATGDSPWSTIGHGLVWHVTWAVVVTVILAPLASWMAEGAASTTSRHAADPRGRRLRILGPCLVSGALVAWITGYLLYLLYQVRLLASSVPPGHDLTQTVRHVADMVHAVLEPRVLWSWPHIAVLAAVLSLPWIAVVARRSTVLVSIAVGSLTAIELPLLIVMSVDEAKDQPLELRWPVGFLAEMNLWWVFVATPLVCAAVAGLCAGVVRQRPLAGAGIAVLTAASIAYAVYALLRPARSCVPALNVLPFSNDESATARCPSFQSPSVLADFVPWILSGAVGAAIVAVPAFAFAGRWLRSLGARRLSPVGRRTAATVTALVIGLAGVLGIRWAAERSVDRAIAAAADQQPVDIGEGGLVSGGGYSVQLVPGWVDITEQALQTPGAPIDRAFRDTAPSTVPVSIVVLHAEDAAGIRDQIRSDESLRPRPVPDIDGEAAVQWRTPGRSKGLHSEIVTEHAGHQYLVQLWGAPGAVDPVSRRHLDDLLSSWQWRAGE